MGVASHKNWQRILRIGVLATTIILLSSYFLHSSGRLNVNLAPLWRSSHPQSTSNEQSSISKSGNSGSDHTTSTSTTTSSPVTTDYPTKQLNNDEGSRYQTRSISQPSSSFKTAAVPSATPSSDGLYEDAPPWEGRVEPTLPDTIPGIPAKIWQSAKTNTFSKDQQKIINSWLEKNPSFRYELLTDESAEDYVHARYYNTRPDIVELYRALPIAILRADFLRYLILLADGGIWSDIDVTCEKDVAHWLPPEYYEDDAPEVGLIVGLEFDIPWEGPGIASQLTNWLIAARPGSPHLLHVVNSIVDGLNGIASEYGVRPNEITLDMISDVVDVTGPKKMTLGIVDSLSQTMGRRIEDRDIANRKSPKLIDDVLVMPGAAFAALQNGYPTDQGDALVSHHYAGSWKGPADEARERRKKLAEQAKAEEEKKAKAAQASR